MKRALSILLSVLMLLSSITCIFTLNVSATELGYDVDLDMGMNDVNTVVTVLANKNNVKGGYITSSDGSYTAVCYKNSTFNGWYDKDGALITKDATVTPPEVNAYYGASFETGNLIIDSGFENYETGSKIYDYSNSEKQDWTTHSGRKVVALTAFGSLFADGSHKVSGNNSIKANPPWQLMTTDVKLQPNTEYYISVNYAYTTQHAGTYMSLEFGLYAPDSAGTNMVSIGPGATYSFAADKTKTQSTWYQAGFFYTTGDSVPEDAVFGYIYQVYNDDESVTTTVENDTNLFLDDIAVIPAEKYNITLDAKNTSTIVPTNGIWFAIENEEYSFTVITEPGLEPVVTANGEALTPDENGIYSFIPTADTVIKVDCGEADIGRPDAGKDYEGRDLTKYNADVYLENIWEGDTVYQETALFITGKDSVKLLYPVDEVISLRSYSLDTTYIKGVDFEITEDGLIKILEGSRIPVYAGDLTTDVKPAENVFPLRDDPAKWLVSIGDVTYAKYAISVTYKHSTTFEDGYQPEAPVVQNKALNGVIEKLENGEDVNIVIYGDSISCGWSSSGLNPTIEIYDQTNTEGNLISCNLNVAPYASTWAQMIEAQLKALYPEANINIKNLSLGGKSSPWGANNIAKRLALWTDEEGNQVTPDLIMVGFGVNDSAGNVTTENFKANMKAIVDTARTATGNADMEALYYSPMLPNQLTETWDANGMLDYENALVELAEADENIGIFKLTSIFAEIIKSKAPEDYLSSYWNHGNDFTARQYATGILAAILGEVPTADAPVTESVTHNSVTLNAKEGYEYSLDGVIWQSENVFTGLNANTEYTFYQRVAETANTYAGATSEVINITTDYMPGDVDGDGKLNLNDVVSLAQYVADWDVKVNTAATDTNGDGEVNLEDVIHLSRYVAGWDGIELH